MIYLLELITIPLILILFYYLSGLVFQIILKRKSRLYQALLSGFLYMGIGLIFYLYIPFDPYHAPKKYNLSLEIINIFGMATIWPFRIWAFII